MGANGLKTKTHPYGCVFVSREGGIRNIPSMGTRDWKTKTHPYGCVFASGEGGIRTRDRILARHSLSRRAHSATLAPPQTLYNCSSDDCYCNRKSRIVNTCAGYRADTRIVRRREWDSNPRWLSPNMFSRHAPSAARPSLHGNLTFRQRRERFYHR